ncbi:MAG TPA: tetratricopeptide repeat protein [Gemmatimonadales bacterium]|nr:tetratricopeptide repeat protein [Gemmatimonadales bacterium]
MSRTFAGYPMLAISTLIPFAIGCGGSDQPKVTSAGATPTVSAASSTEAEIPAATTAVSYERAESVFREGHYSEATQLFAAYTATDPENPWGHYMLGMSLWKAGEREKALSAFDQALQLDPDHRKSLFNSSRVLLESGRPKEALERIEKALGQEPMSNEGLRLLGRTRYDIGEVEGAIGAYRRALSLDERDVWSMNNLGLIYIQQDRSLEALAPLARAVEIRSNAPVFQNNLGTALERSGYPKAAAEAYEAAIAVDSTYQKASVGLARVTTEQKPETSPVDLATLSSQFQASIETWRGAVADSSMLPVVVVEDSSTVSVDTVSDPVLVSGRIVSDSLEECESEEDK